MTGLAVAAIFLLLSGAHTISVVSHFREPRWVPRDLVRLGQPVFTHGVMWWVGLAFSVLMAAVGQATVVAVLLTVPLTALDAAFLVGELFLAFGWAAVLWRSSEPHVSDRLGQD